MIKHLYWYHFDVRLIYVELQFKFLRKLFDIWVSISEQHKTHNKSV